MKFCHKWNIQFSGSLPPVTSKSLGLHLLNDVNFIDPGEFRLCFNVHTYIKYFRTKGGVAQSPFLVLYILCEIVTCISNIFAENLCGLKIQFLSGFWMMYVCIALCKHYYSAVMLRDFLMIYTLRSYVTYCKSTIYANWNILLLLFNNFLFEESGTSAHHVLKYFLMKFFCFYVFSIFNFHIVQAINF